jgi:drug/metabolite transporter (DMT)-like permease
MVPGSREAVCWSGRDQQLLTPCIAVLSSVRLAGESLHPHDLATIAMIAAALLLVMAEQLRVRRCAQALIGEGNQSGEL